MVIFLVIFLYLYGPQQPLVLKAVSTSSKIIIDVAPVADNPNLKVRATVPGEEDAGRDANGNIVSNISESKPIPLPFRFELGDKSETISINVKLLDSSDTPISGASWLQLINRMVLLPR